MKDITMLNAEQKIQSFFLFFVFHLMLLFVCMIWNNTMRTTSLHWYSLLRFWFVSTNVPMLSFTTSYIYRIGSNGKQCHKLFDIKDFWNMPNWKWSGWQWLLFKDNKNIEWLRLCDGKLFKSFKNSLKWFNLNLFTQSIELNRLFNAHMNGIFLKLTCVKCVAQFSALFPYANKVWFSSFWMFHRFHCLSWS